jgi:hypothetical protein
VDLFLFFFPTDPTFLFKDARRGTWCGLIDIYLEPLCPDAGWRTLGLV